MSTIQLNRPSQPEIINEGYTENGSLLLEEAYRFQNKNDVTHYLNFHTKLVNFLLQAYPHLSKHFGTNARFVLEIVNDPESERKQLMVYIQTFLPLDEALDRLNQFDNDWFLKQINWVEDLVNFNLEIR